MIKREDETWHQQSHKFNGYAMEGPSQNNRNNYF